MAALCRFEDFGELLGICAIAFGGEGRCCSSNLVLAIACVESWDCPFYRWVAHVQEWKLSAFGKL